ncbi:MAG: hypothetical protein Q8909_11835 [Bacteroidota bacterium]|uniref:hypothetical protein n=1 Tax=Parabacteroides sp. FAFU027 TaxID=2922715 RepID=UPI001FAED27F|nr:hypothetical protein [Parabacteroides sp. FAFU027]MDP4270800.1 hypothetical protein [Bacteroidota bacterium]
MRTYLKEWIRENLFAEDPEEYLASILKNGSPELHDIVKDLSSERMNSESKIFSHSIEQSDNTVEMPDEQPPGQKEEPK